ncbi:putative uncharacterized protein [Waddlia chondrophila 2032/99]|uniref:Uncharacterized protein n=3 Tax=Waddlia chondrophila TaxID=71667 RepID=D6YU17_WADCW|nr:hypothetical protein wcw_0253 [Waddlia chondrophila WSU 86-1044]CCB90625.1 putative uncharacterized protein [Waddlia chondrophila 2032/99]
MQERQIYLEMTPILKEMEIMKISVDLKQREVYLEEGALLLEEILTSDQQEKIFKEIEMVQSTSGRDLWRKNHRLRQLPVLRPVVNVASQLLGENLIRLGYDQYLPHLNGIWMDWVHGKASLRDLGSYRGEVCSVLLPLTGRGDALYVRPEWKLDLAEWVDTAKPHYLVLYSTLKAQYTLNKKDPAAAEMVRLGYNNGDRLREEINPVVHR